MRPWLRILLSVELLVGVVPLTALYLYMFPAGVEWVGETLRLVARGNLTLLPIGNALAIVLGGLGLIALWITSVRRLLGWRMAGRLVVTGLAGGIAAAVFVLAVTIAIGAWWLDYVLFGTPILVAAHQIVAIVKARRTASGRRSGAAGASAPAVVIVAWMIAASSADAGASDGRPRVPAEWEPAVGALVAWPPIVPDALLVEIARDDRLYLLVGDAKDRVEAEAAVARLKIDSGRVEFIDVGPGEARHWPRDWGPFPLFDAHGAFHLADPRFLDYPMATSRCDGRLYRQPYSFLIDFGVDDAATARVADALGVPRRALPFALTGGNALVDGLGTSFSTCVMLNENHRYLGVGEDEFRRLVAADLGIDRAVIVPNFEWIGIQHIDCLMKPLNDETLLVKRVPATHPDYEKIEAIVRALASITGARGRPYRIERIDTPPYLLGYFVANYTNSLILNRKILVPLFGIPGDQAALETFRRLMPGYEVIGFENKGRDGWNWTDALHCRVRAVWDREMLYLDHRRLDDAAPPAGSYRVEATIIDHSREGLIAEELRLAWRLRGEANWRMVPLEPASGPGAYAAAIPSPGPRRTVEYYLAAADRSGRRETLPRVAPAGFYSFTVGGPSR